jgi:hypothetical protein
MYRYPKWEVVNGPDEDQAVIMYQAVMRVCELGETDGRASRGQPARGHDGQCEGTGLLPARRVMRDVGWRHNVSD